VDIFGNVTPLLELGCGFHPDFTGRQNIFLEAPLLGLSREQVHARLPEILSFSEIKNIDQPLRFYSSGMIIRLAFSLAMQSDSPIIILDETLGGGDFRFKEKSLEAIHKMATQGRAILIVAHDEDLIKNHCTRALWIDKGVLRQSGPAGLVVDNYLQSFMGKCRLVPEKN
jgi:ABC-type polysaccharide/polyol phosphate transport system ATPase subunit